MKTPLTNCAVVFAASLMLAGCAGTPSSPDANPNHPANPHAAASSVPPLETGRLSLTHVTVAPAAAAPAEHRHGDK